MTIKGFQERSPEQSPHEEQPRQPAGQAICHGCLAYAYGKLGRHHDAELHARQPLLCTRK